MPSGAPCPCGSLLLLTGLIPPLSTDGSWALEQTGVRSWDWIALSPLTVIVCLLNSFSHPFILWMLATMRPWSSQCGILKLEKSGQRQQTNPFIILGANNVKHFHLQTSTEGGCTLCDVPGAEKVSVHTLSVCRHLVSFLAGSEPTFGTFGNFGFRAASVPLDQRNIAKGQRSVCLGCCGVKRQWKAKITSVARFAWKDSVFLHSEKRHLGVLHFISSELLPSLLMLASA